MGEGFSYLFRMRALALLLLFSATAGAQEPADGPKRILRDPFIEQLAGDWQLTRQIRGREVQNTVHAEWVLNHQFLSAIGYGKRAGDAIEFAFQYDDGPFFNTFAWNALAHAWTFTMESGGTDGKRGLFAVDTLRRK